MFFFECNIIHFFQNNCFYYMKSSYFLGVKKERWQKKEKDLIFFQHEYCFFLQSKLIFHQKMYFFSQDNDGNYQLYSSYHLRNGITHQSGQKKCQHEIKNKLGWGSALGLGNRNLKKTIWEGLKKIMENSI